MLKVLATYLPPKKVSLRYLEYINALCQLYYSRVNNVLHKRLAMRVIYPLKGIKSDYVAPMCTVYTLRSGLEIEVTTLNMMEIGK